MKYLFSALYVIGTLIVVLNICQFFISGWAWGPAVRIVIALLFLYFNYRFMKEAYRAKEQRNKDFRKPHTPDTNQN